MSLLRQRLDDYFAVRRAVGFKLVNQRELLQSFIAHLEQRGARTVTVELALSWATLPADADSSWWSKRLGMVRSFAKYLQTLEPATQVPPSDLLPSRSRRATPYVYSDRDVSLLMQAARRQRRPLLAGTYGTLIGLLAATGIRVGEAIRLDRDHVDFSHRLLVVHDSKFRKSREVALHETTVDALRSYVELRDRLCLRPRAPSFFVSTVGTRLIYKNVQHKFLELVREVGLAPRSARCRPRIHDLRHSFIVKTLVRWYQAGADVEARMPLLSTYVGHVGPSSTYWYLSAVPELLALVGQRLERSLGEMP